MERSGVQLRLAAALCGVWGDRPGLKPSPHWGTGELDGLHCRKRTMVGPVFRKMKL
jgi:hypothetical protein